MHPLLLCVSHGGGGMHDGVVRPGIELFTKEVLPVLKTLGREPTTSRAKD